MLKGKAYVDRYGNANLFGPMPDEWGKTGAITLQRRKGTPADRPTLLRRMAARAIDTHTIYETLRDAGFHTLTLHQVVREVQRFNNDLAVLHDLGLIDDKHYMRRLKELKSDFIPIDEPEPAVISASLFDDDGPTKSGRVRLAKRSKERAA
jgi:hypothetical protein